MSVEDWGKDEPEDDALDLADAIALLGKAGDPVPTGFPPLDRNLRGGGLTPGRILAIIGPPGSGKTTLAAMILNHMAPTAPGLALFSDEGRDAAAVKLGQQLGYKREDLERGAPELHDFMKERMEETFLLPDPDSPIASASRALAVLADFAPSRNGAARLCVLDSAQTIPWTADQEEDPEDRMAITRLSYSFRKEIKKRGWFGVMTAQASYDAFKHKANEKNLNPLAAAAGSRAVIYAADTALVFGIPNDDDIGKVWIAKNRLGRKGSFAVKLDRERASLMEVDSSELESQQDREKEQASADKVKRAATKILSQLAKMPGQTSTQLAETCHTQKAQVLKALAALREDGKVTATQKPRGSLVYDLT